MKYDFKTYTHHLGGADGCSVAVLCRGVWGEKYILRGTEAGTEQSLVETHKGRTSKTSVGQNFKEISKCGSQKRSEMARSYFR